MCWERFQPPMAANGRLEDEQTADRSAIMEIILFKMKCSSTLCLMIPLYCLCLCLHLKPLFSSATWPKWFRNAVKCSLFRFGRRFSNKFRFLQLILSSYRWLVTDSESFHCFLQHSVIYYFLTYLLSRCQQRWLQPFPRGSRVCRYYPKGRTSYREWRLSREDLSGFQWKLFRQRPQRGELGTEECQR